MKKIKKEFGVSLDWIAGYDTGEDLEYKKIISDLENSNIKPEQLKKIVDIIREQ